jgi:periplasmic protein CpxP/Spy
MSTKSRWVMLTVLVVLVAGPLLMGQAAQTPQTSAPQDQNAMGGHREANGPDAHLQMLTRELNLTDDQQTKLKPILEDQAQQMKTVRHDTALSQDQKKAKIKEIHASFHDQISNVLTPEQQAKLKQMKQSGMEKHKGMKEGGTEHQ